MDNRGAVGKRVKKKITFDGLHWLWEILVFLAMFSCALGTWDGIGNSDAMATDGREHAKGLVVKNGHGQKEMVS